jgi:hypothetical protein
LALLPPARAAEAFVLARQRASLGRFLRDGETGIHTLTRLTLPDADPANSTIVNLGNIQELRQVIAPSRDRDLWSHMVTNQIQYAHLPSKAAQANETVVQDATWWIGNAPNESYVREQCVCRPGPAVLPLTADLGPSPLQVRLLHQVRDGRLLRRSQGEVSV